MRKTAIIISVILGLSLAASAQEKGGLFNRGFVSDEKYYGSYIFNDRLSGDELLPLLPSHGFSSNQDAPLGGGVLLLAAFGAAYALKSKRKE